MLQTFDSFLHQKTPLHMAAERGHKYTVGYLIHRGADFNIEDNAGVSAHARLFYRQWIITVYLYFPLQQLTPLHLAARKGHVDTVHYVVGQGVDIDIRNHNLVMYTNDYCTARRVVLLI